MALFSTFVVSLWWWWCAKFEYLTISVCMCKMYWRSRWPHDAQLALWACYTRGSQVQIPVGTIWGTKFPNWFCLGALDVPRSSFRCSGTYSTGNFLLWDQVSSVVVWHLIIIIILSGRWFKNRAKPTNHWPMLSPTIPTNENIAVLLTILFSSLNIEVSWVKNGLGPFCWHIMLLCITWCNCHINVFKFPIS